jgi:PAS domain S-box-containing protein
VTRVFFRRAELLWILTALLVLLCLGMFSAVDWLDYQRDRDEALALRRIFAHTSALPIALKDAETGQRGFLLTGDPAYLEPYGQALRTIRSELDALDASTAYNKSIHDRVGGLRAPIGASLTEMAETVDVRRQGDAQKSLSLFQTGKGEALMESIWQLIGQIGAEEACLSDARSLALQARSDRAHLIAILSSAFLLIILGLGARNIHRAAARREQLIAQLDDLTAALDKAQTMIHTLDGTILVWNRGAEELYGWPRQEAIGRQSHELLESELPRPLEEIRAELMERGSWSGECKQRRRDGSSIWVASHWALHRNAAGEPASVVRVSNDITELKRVTEALRTSEATIRSLFENAHEAILTADREGRIVDANAMVERLFEYSRAELIGASMEMLLPETLRNGHIGHRADYERDPTPRPMGQGLELVARRKDGSAFPVEISLSYIAQSAGDGLAVAFISDITARQKDEWERNCLIASLESALSEKTTLLKEVHHRVKNNLAVIAGLLGLQADTIEDKRANIALAESQQRVASMALIHEYLYATEHLDRVNFGQYVRQLSTEVCQSYPTRRHLVSFRVVAEEIELGVNQAIPCGLILNELLSNAFKYAFPQGLGGNIDVHFRRIESGQLLLSCGDDGAGMPEGFDWQDSHSLGLRIAMILARQLGGTLTLDRSAGTRFELSFPETCKI